MLLANECCKRGVAARRSTIKHGSARSGLFASRCFRERDVAGPYCGSLAYENPGQEYQSTKRYGEGYMEVSAESFRGWAVRLEERACDSQGLKHSVWFVSFSFCAMRFITDQRYLPGDKDGTKVRRWSGRKAHVQFKAASRKSRADFRKNDLVQVVALRSFNVVEELFLHYGI